MMTRKEIEIINAVDLNDVKKLRKILDLVVRGSIEMQDEILTSAIKKGNLEMVQLLMDKCKFILVERSFYLALLHCEDDIANYLKTYLKGIK